MKYFFPICISLLVIPALAQPIDSIRVIEPDKETSFENYELLILAIVGFVILMVMRIWFSRTRKH